MSFDLRIHFVGLNLFVPEPDKLMHVLLPTMNSADPNHHHHARIIYDQAYEHPGQRELSRRFVHVNIEGGVVDFSKVPVAEIQIDTFIPAEIPSISEFTVPVDRKYVENLPDKTLVTARMVISSGALSFYGLGATFNLKISDAHVLTQRRMSARTEWTIRGVKSQVGTDLGLQLGLMGSDVVGAGKKLPNLFPIGGTIHLLVFNAVAAEFPPEGEDFYIEKQSKDADHFHGYYGLCPPYSGKPNEHIPTRAEALYVGVYPNGDEVPNKGKQTPGLTCLQAQARLAENPNLLASEKETRERTLPHGQHAV